MHCPQVVFLAPPAPPSSEALREQGSQLFRAGHFDEAAAVYGKALAALTQGR